MHRDSGKRFQVQTVPTLVKPKRLGFYLVEAGLISDAQIKVALNDQIATGMKLGEVLATRGWVKQQTVEFIMRKVVVPERRAIERKKKKFVEEQQKFAPKPHPLASSTVAAPQDRSAQPRAGRDTPSASSQTKGGSTYSSHKRKEDVPISKPLPSVPPKGNDVSWAG
ncbi:MAG: hypothetical protein WBA57_03100 [Elainellaceae cyanobacterium]